MLRRPGANGDDRERGAIMIMAAVSLVVLIAAAALAVDTGGRAEERRTDQRVADMAALDAVQHLDADPVTEAGRSAQRNGFTAPSDRLTSVVTGTWDATAKTFTAGGTPLNAVQVSVASQYNDFFGGGTPTLTATAIAALQSGASFLIGSSLADVNAGLGPFGGAKLDLLGYNGLASGNVTLGDLARAVGCSAVTVDDALNCTASVAQIVDASSTLLSNSDPTASASLTALGAALIGSSYDANNTVTLGNVLGLQQGNGVGLGTTVNLLQAVGGAIQVANGEAGIATDLNVSLADVTGAKLAVTAVEPAKASNYGPACPAPLCATGSDPQATATIAVDITIPLVLTANVVMGTTLGDATGKLTKLCEDETPNDIHIGTTFQPVDLTVVSATVKSLTSLTSGSFTGDVLVNSESVPDAEVDDPANWYDTNPQAPVNVTSSPGTVTPNLQASSPDPLLGPLVTQVADVLTADAGPLVSAADTALSALGINVGSADYLGLRNDCGLAALVK